MRRPYVWQADSDACGAARIRRIGIRRGRSGMGCAHWLTALAGDADFGTFFNAVLAEAPFAAFFWEMPLLMQDSIHRPFECVLVDSPALAGRQADPGAFAERFAGAREGIAGFRNLARDAWLIAPCPAGPKADFAHLAAFVRHAPAALQQAFWRHVGETVRARLSGQPLWLSTSGLGVSWLHVRLDTRPKYYAHRPYTRQAGSPGQA